MPASYSWDLVAEFFSGTLPDPGTYVPSVPKFGADSKKVQFERGIKFANVPGGKPENVVHGGPRIWHVNSVQNLMQDPIDKSVVAGPGSYSGAVKYRNRSYRKNVELLPSVASPSDGRNLDSFGNEQFFQSFSDTRTNSGHILDDSTEALWRFDSDTFTVKDITKNERNLTMYSGVPVITGKIGLARYLTGSANSAQVMHAPGDSDFVLAMQDEWTVEAWINPNSDTPAIAGVIFILNGENFSFNEEEKIILQFQLSTDKYLQTTTWMSYTNPIEVTFTNAQIQPSRWTHVALVRERVDPDKDDQYRYKVYVDAVLKETGAPFDSPEVVYTPGVYFVGVGSYVTNSGLGSGDSLFEGGIDDMRVSSVARTQTEILESYTRGAVRI